MKAICVDDEELILYMIVKMCESLPQLDEVKGFKSATQALDWVKENHADVAFLDIDMPEMNGINLAAEMKNAQPDLSVVFVTGYSEYALDAFRVHASGYLLKPINKEKLEKEVEYALSQKSVEEKKPAHIEIRTFGEFDVFVDGNVVNFKRAKARELLAYLVDREGGSVSRAAAFSVLWGDEAYDRSKQKQIDVIVRSLRETLKEYGIEEILSIERGMLRVNTEKFDCDLYHFLKGDIAMINRYRGEYMNQYSWAGLTEALITNKVN